MLLKSPAVLFSKDVQAIRMFRTREIIVAVAILKGKVSRIIPDINKRKRKKNPAMNKYFLGSNHRQ